MPANELYLVLIYKMRGENKMRVVWSSKSHEVFTLTDKQAKDARAKAKSTLTKASGIRGAYEGTNAQIERILTDLGLRVGDF